MGVTGPFFVGAKLECPAIANEGFSRALRAVPALHTASRTRCRSSMKLALPYIDLGEVQQEYKT